MNTKFFSHRANQPLPVLRTPGLTIGPVELIEGNSLEELHTKRREMIKMLIGLGEIKDETEMPRMHILATGSAA